MKIDRSFSMSTDEALDRLHALSDYWSHKYVEGKLDDYLNPARTLDELRARIP